MGQGPHSFCPEAPGGQGHVLASWAAPQGLAQGGLCLEWPRHLWGPRPRTGRALRFIYQDQPGPPCRGRPSISPPHFLTALPRCPWASPPPLAPVPAQQPLLRHGVQISAVGDTSLGTHLNSGALGFTAQVPLTHFTDEQTEVRMGIMIKCNASASSRTTGSPGQASQAGTSSDSGPWFQPAWACAQLED